MRKIWNKGHRIRASDKHLVYHFSIGTLLFVFVAVLLLLNIKQLMRTDWEHFSLLENGLTLSPYNFITKTTFPTVALGSLRESLAFFWKGRGVQSPWLAIPNLRKVR